MMKKTYITPNTEVILLNVQQPLLDMSLNNGEIDTQFSREEEYLFVWRQ